MKTLLIVSALWVLTTCSPSTPEGSALGIANTAFAGKVVKDVLNDFDSIAQGLINQANNSGSALISQTGNQANVLLQNTRIALNEDLDKTYDRLSSERRVILAEVNQALKKLSQVQDATFRIADTLALDLTELTNRTPGFQKTDFLIRRISGIATFVKPTRHVIELLGIGFGPDSSNAKSEVRSVHIAGQNLPFSVERTEQYLTKVVLENKDIAPFFPAETARKGTSLNVDIEMFVQRKNWGWSQATHHVKFNLLVLPLFCSSVTVEYQVPHFEWVKIGDPSYQKITNSHDQRGGDIRHFSYDFFEDIKDNQRFRTPWASGEGEMTGFSTLDPNFNPVAGRAKPYVSPDGHRVGVQFEMWGPPFTVHWGAILEEHRKTKSDAKEIKDLKVIYGHPLEIRLPLDVEYWRIKGETIEHVGIDLPKDGDSDILLFKGQSEAAKEKILIYQILPPKGMSL